MKYPLFRSLRMENGALPVDAPPPQSIRQVREDLRIEYGKIGTPSMVMAYRSCLTSTRPLAVGRRTPNGR